MFQITPQMRVLVAIEPVDGRKGIDSLAQLCGEKLTHFPGVCSCFEAVVEPPFAYSPTMGKATGFYKNGFRKIAGSRQAR